jgi:drug/metabolite transporter (DMT)-like permease
MTLWQRHSWLAYLAVLTGVFGHASSEFVSVLTGLGGPETSVWRFGLGGAGLVIVALSVPASRDLITPLRHDGLRIAGLSGIVLVLSYLAFHWSLDFATVPQVATLVTTIPIFVAITAAIVDRTGLAGVKIVTGVLAFLGVALLITDGYLGDLSGSRRNLFGIGLVIFNAATTAFYLVLMRPLIREYGALRITALSMMIGGMGLWILVGVIWGNWVDFTSIAS